MFDPLHGEAEPSRTSEVGADHDVKIEQLLLAGLDHYFQAQYERAIDLWTRVLFLDRSHARARAYIERARAALAERLRESEELLHTGAEAFKRGNVGEARQLLSSAVEHGGGRDEALALLDRLNRLETAAGRRDAGLEAPRSEHGRRARRTIGPAEVAPRPVRVVPLVALCAALLAGVYVAASWDQFESMLFISRVQPAPSPTPAWRQALPVPSGSALALARAGRLVEDQRVHDALRLLATIEPGDPLKSEADALRATIQRGLLAVDGVDRRELPPAASQRRR